VNGQTTIPVGGLPVWATPDPATQPTTRAQPGLPVQVLEYANGWAKISFSNGWVGWADARAFAPPAGPPAAASKPAITPLPGLGLVLVVVGSFLPWFTATGADGSAWDIPLPSLFDHLSTSEDPKTGLVLLVVLLAGLPYLTRRPLPRLAYLALAAVAAGAVIGTKLFIDELEVVDPGIGMVVTAAGAFLLAAECFGAGRNPR
jgi:hypothetical protein